jgi:hypothetical protein
MSAITRTKSNGRIIPMGEAVVFEGGLQIAVELITPELAARLLENNVRNRTVRPRGVDELARAMRAGDYDGLNGETLKLDDEGYVVDGQHRLKAIVKSSVSTPMVVIRGVPGEAWETVDTGRKRTFGDVLSRRGEINANSLAAATRWSWIHDRGELANATNNLASHAELSRYLEANPGLREAVVETLTLTKGGVLGGMNAMAAAMVYACYRNDPDEAAEFFSRLKTGDQIAKGDGLFELREALIRHKTTAKDRRVGSIVIAALIIKAFNIWRAGEPIQLLGWRRGGKQREDFPTLNPPVAG